MMLGLLAAPLAQAEENLGDDTLSYHLAKADLVVIGKITSDAIGTQDEVGAVTYGCEFQVQDVLKGNAEMKGRAITVRILRFEMEAKDRHPQLRKDGECILFLKSSKPARPYWDTADLWFGVQHPSPSMARALKRLGAKK